MNPNFWMSAMQRLLPVANVGLPVTQQLTGQQSFMTSS
jgi:hypothetical protein